MVTYLVGLVSGDGTAVAVLAAVVGSGALVIVGVAVAAPTERRRRAARDVLRIMFGREDGDR